MFSIGVTSAAYIAASILFILSLGGLSNQESAKRAVWYGIVGMAIAVIATVFGPGVYNIFLILIAVAVGAFAGYYVAGRVQMTEMPQLVAALHSFVGLAAVFIGLNADIMLTSVLDMKAKVRDDPLTDLLQADEAYNLILQTTKSLPCHHCHRGEDFDIQEIFNTFSPTSSIQLHEGNEVR